MKKKRLAVAALASCIALSAAFTGCSLISTNNRTDMAQTIATINITKADKFNNTDGSEDNLSVYASAVSDTTIIKRNLVSYFLNVGYSYVQNGTSYKDTFNMLLNALVENAIMVQYSTLQLLDYTAKETGKSAQTVLAEFNDENKTKAQKYEYLLDDDEVMLAKYKWYSSLNSAIDSYENKIIEEENGYTGTDTRTTPTNLNTEQDDYYPVAKDGGLDYYVYTGYEGYLLKDSGVYRDDAIDGTSRATRVKAYNLFINSLRSNNLVDSQSEAENLTKVTELKYIQDEYVTQLESQVINKYYEIYESQLEDKLLEGDHEYVQYLYDVLLNDQTTAYDSAPAFETALSSMSSSSFILYSPDTDDASFDLDGNYGVNYGRYGFVYNILLPFSAKQSAQLSELNSIKTADEDEDWYYNERNKLLANIKTTDQREAWFNGATDYSFKPDASFGDYYGKSDGREYLFFEGNLTDSEEGGRYKKLQAYEGKYSYNGKVYENDDGSYTLIPEELTIDGMLDEFSAYINYVTGINVAVNYTDNYYGNYNKKFKTDDDEIDYSQFLYASGKVNFGAFNPSDLFNPDSLQYKAMSAVNELQYAYTTDTSVLSQYVGYSVSAYDTNYIKEFEYAAKLAISNGAGSFAVCAGDYGWHLIYVTYVFDAGNTYNDIDWNRIETEGTFENLFFEWVKSNHLTDVTTSRRSKIVGDYNKEGVSVVKYQSRYQDLLDLGN